jgi:predicted nuclease of predicted toxin-antitoxin system
MNFLLDENFPKSAETLLLNLGHQVIDVRGTHLQGVDDFRLFELAQQNEAVLLTTDRDFYHTIPLTYPTHCGVIVIALKRPNRVAILVRLEWIVAHSLIESIKDTVILLRDNSYRVRRS